MARSVLGSFVSGTRQMVAAQLIVSIGAVALGGWTLAVTTELIRERDRLQDRVIQLEETLASRDIVVPPAVELVDPPQAQTAYPPSAGGAAEPEAQDSEPAPPPQAEPAPEQPPQQADDNSFRPTDVIGGLFAPPPQMRTIVLHVRSEADRAYAARIARELGAATEMRVVVDVMPPRDPRQSGYAYFDGRQSRASAAIVQRFHDIARRYEIAAWSAQLRGVALPAQGEYSADRLDIVLPPLPQTAQPNPRLQVDPRLLQREPLQRDLPAPIR